MIDFLTLAESIGNPMFGKFNVFGYQFLKLIRVRQIRNLIEHDMISNSDSFLLKLDSHFDETYLEFEKRTAPSPVPIFKKKSARSWSRYGSFLTSRVLAHTYFQNKLGVGVVVAGRLARSDYGSVSRCLIKSRPSRSSTARSIETTQNEDENPQRVRHTTQSVD